MVEACEGIDDNTWKAFVSLPSGDDFADSARGDSSFTTPPSFSAKTLPEDVNTNIPVPSHMSVIAVYSSWA